MTVKPVITDDLELYLPLNESSTGTSYDYSGNGNDGTDTGTSIVKIPYGSTRARSFNGSSDYIDTPVNSISGARTFNVWLKGTESTAYRGIIGDMSTVSSPYGGLLLKTDDVGTGKAAVIGFNSTKSVTDTVTSTTVINDDVWHMVTMTYNGTNFKIYVDGTLEDTSINITIGTTNVGIEIGRDVDQGSRYAGFTISEAKVWNRTLTPEEIKAIYKNTYRV